jgi:hypothetical protein
LTTEAVLVIDFTPAKVFALYNKILVLPSSAVLKPAWSSGLKKVIVLWDLG